MRKALIVGINYYKNINILYGCVNDAYEIKNVLDRNSDGTKNFHCKLLTAVDSSSSITRKDLKNSIEELFDDNSDISLLYFSGHGYVDSLSGYLITSENSDGDDGLSMNDILQIANKAKCKNKIILLDCCHAGFMGKTSTHDSSSFLSDGMTILTASSETQYAIEEDGSGVFTRLFVDAMNGSAGNLVGDITPGSIYAHIDQSLGPWEQRPIFKTNVRTFTTLRKVQSPIELEDLKKIVNLFPDISIEFKLDPTFEPESDDPIEENCEKFALLQKYNRLNLVVPVGETHMYFAAMNSKSCKLTVLGEHYWNLIKKDRI